MLGVRVGQVCKSANIFLLSETYIIPTTTKKSTQWRSLLEAINIHSVWARAGNLATLYIPRLQHMSNEAELPNQNQLCSWFAIMTTIYNFTSITTDGTSGQWSTILNNLTAGTLKFFKKVYYFNWIPKTAAKSCSLFCCTSYFFIFVAISRAKSG